MGDPVKRGGKRAYPPFYERVVPIALGCIAVAIVAIILVILAALYIWFPR